MDWIRLHYETEKDYADKILSSPKYSQERKHLISEAYDKIKEISDHYNPGSSETGHTEIVFRIIERLIGNRGSVFDIGCARGDLVRLLLDRGYQAKGIDISDDYINNAKTLLSTINAESSVKKEDIEDFQSEDSFDVVVMDNVIEHIVPDMVEDILEKCYSMTSQNGYLIIITPHKYSGPHDISYKYLNLGDKAEGLHLKEYSFTEIVHFLRKAGFKKVLGLPIWPGLSKKINMKPSGWASKKALLFEGILEKTNLKRLLRLNRTITEKLVSILFPGICIGKKINKDHKKK